MKKKRRKRFVRPLPPIGIQLKARVIAVGNNAEGIPEVEFEVPLAMGRKFTVWVPAKPSDASKIGDLLYKMVDLRIEIIPE